jgi:hypothetical protein
MDLKQKTKLIDDFVKNQGIIARAAWGALPSKIPDVPDSYDWDYGVVVIHHSGRSGESDPNAVQVKHMNKNGWDDVGYHFMVNAGGTVYEGRRLIYKGSHTENANTGKVGILVMGNFDKAGWLGFLGSTPSASQLAGVTRLVIALKGLFPTLTTLGGHKDYKKSTECPGTELYSRLDDLRKATGLRAP